MTHEALLDLDIRLGEASMEWYRAMWAWNRGEVTWEAMLEAEQRVLELDRQLAFAHSASERSLFRGPISGDAG